MAAKESREFRIELDGKDEGCRLPAIGAEGIFILFATREWSEATQISLFRNDSEITAR